eukprot:TRINITY_DN30501_c0_g1_i2.p1 TRINITY_DN30501_c0_g1~~TRINITY_DN30501_c0_g1_i2.p1  ORF type:complete len:475 (-),score=86.98 TRINITY_DN30501_c0_g1_i2:24-1448(-)
MVEVSKAVAALIFDERSALEAATGASVSVDLQRSLLEISGNAGAVQSARKLIDERVHCRAFHVTKKVMSEILANRTKEELERNTGARMSIEKDGVDYVVEVAGGQEAVGRVSSLFRVALKDNVRKEMQMRRGTLSAEWRSSMCSLGMVRESGDTQKFYAELSGEKSTAAQVKKSLEDLASRCDQQVLIDGADILRFRSDNVRKQVAWERLLSVAHHFHVERRMKIQIFLPSQPEMTNQEFKKLMQLYGGNSIHIFTDESSSKMMRNAAHVLSNRGCPCLVVTNSDFHELQCSKIAKVVRYTFIDSAFVPSCLEGDGDKLPRVSGSSSSGRNILQKERSRSRERDREVKQDAKKTTHVCNVKERKEKNEEQAKEQLSAIDTLTKLRKFEGKVESIESKLQNQLKMLNDREVSPGQAKSSLAQIEAELQQIQCKGIDSIPTGGLPDTLRNQKKQLTKSVDALLNDLDAAFDRIKQM